MSRNPFRAALLPLPLLLLLLPACGVWRGDETRAAGEGMRAAASGQEGAETDRVADRVGDPVVRPRAVPPAPDALHPERVLFLPFYNRTTHRLHVYALRGLDRTLAAHAGLHLGRPVVDPELAWRLGREAGISGPLTAATLDELTPEELADLAHRTGAGVVVWGELTKEGEAHLHAETLHPEADATPWDGLRIELPALVQDGLYDAPRALVAAVGGGAGGVPEGGSVPASAIEALEAARDRAWAGRAPATRRAERALADLAVAHPTWPRPLVELASLRMTRALAFEADATTAWLGEGPLVPRHLALLFPDLDATSRARLSAIDAIVRDQQTSWEAHGAAIGALPEDDLLRAVAARAAGAQPRERFGLDGVAASGPAARWLLETERQRHGKLTAFTFQRLRNTAPAALLHHDALLRSFLEAALQQGDWTAQRAATLARVPGGVARILGAAGEVCAAAPEDAARACRERLHAFLVADLPDLPVEALADAEATDGAVDAWAALFLSPAPERLAERVPELPLFARDPAFAASWDASSRLARHVGEALRAAEAGSGTLAAPAHLLTADVRDEIRRGRAVLTDAVFEPAWVGSRRGNAEKESAPYRDAIAELDLTPPRARYLWLQLQGALGETDFYHRHYTWLVEMEPWNALWARKWIDRHGVQGKPPAVTAKRFEQVLPRPQAGTHLVAHAWREAGEPEKARAILEEALAVAPHDDQVELLAYLMVRLRRPVADRVRYLEAAAPKLPGARSVTSDLAWARLVAGDYDGAERLFAGLVSGEHDEREACKGLLEVAHARGPAGDPLAAAGTCLENASNKWVRARVLTWTGDLHRHAGALEEAEASYRAARDEVGGAAWIIYGLGHVTELRGRSEEADRHYAFVESHYDDGRATWRRAALDLREGRTQAARERLLARMGEGWLPAVAVRTLGRLEARDGSPERFLEALATRSPDRVAEPLAELRAHDLGDLEGGLAVLDAHLREHPDDDDAWATKARILADSGRLEEAVAAAEDGLADGGTADLRLLQIRALAEAGRVEEARRELQRWRDRFPVSIPVARADFHVLRAEGRAAEARSRIRSVWERRVQFGLVERYWMDALGWLQDEMRLGLASTGREDLRWMRARAEGITEHIPWEADAWEALARLHEALDEPKRAAAARRTAATVGGPAVEATRIGATTR